MASPSGVLHHFHLTKGFQKTPDYSAIYRSERHPIVFHIDQIVPGSFVYYLNKALLWGSHRVLTLGSQHLYYLNFFTCNQRFLKMSLSQCQNISWEVKERAIVVLSADLIQSDTQFAKLPREGK